MHEVGRIIVVEAIRPTDVCFEEYGIDSEAEVSPPKNMSKDEALQHFYKLFRVLDNNTKVAEIKFVFPCRVVVRRDHPELIKMNRCFTFEYNGDVEPMLVIAAKLAQKPGRSTDKVRQQLGKLFEFLELPTTKSLNERCS